MDPLYTFWDNIAHYKTKSVHVWGLMNSATKALIATLVEKIFPYKRLGFSNLYSLQCRNLIKGSLYESTIRGLFSQGFLIRFLHYTVTHTQTPLDSCRPLYGFGIAPKPKTSPKRPSLLWFGRPNFIMVVYMDPLGY